MSGIGLINAIIAVGTWVGLAVTFVVKGIVLVFIMALIAITLQPIDQLLG